MRTALPLLPTTVIGSYPQPDWLIDRDRLSSVLPPRVRAKELWRIPEPYLEAAQDDATLLAIRAQERAGVDIITDGEMRRESYSNRFATALEGVDLEHHGHALSRTGKPDIVPRVVGPVRRLRPVEVRDVEFLRANTDHQIKITVPGPFTMSQQAQDDHYGSQRALGLDLAAALNEELRDLQAAGADVLQIDEPYLQSRAEAARTYAVEAINRALHGITVSTVLHTCFGYAQMVKHKQGQYTFLEELNETTADQLAIEAAQPNLDLAVLARLTKTVILGVIDLSSLEVEPPALVAERTRAALAYLPPERLVLAPDCGMKYLPRDVAFGKLRSLVEGARLVRLEQGARA